MSGLQIRCATLWNQSWFAVVDPNAKNRHGSPRKKPLVVAYCKTYGAARVVAGFSPIKAVETSTTRKAGGLSVDFVANYQPYFKD